MNTKTESGNGSNRGRGMREPQRAARRLHTQGRQPAGMLTLLSRARYELLEPRAARDVAPDPLDAAKELEEEQLWLVYAEQRHEIHTEIEQAIQLLGEGRYGQCVECGIHIPAARLWALPFALRCVACQERIEGAERRVGRPRPSM
jgi:RNA polymerase-binding transcription factor